MLQALLLPRIIARQNVFIHYLFRCLSFVGGLRPQIGNTIAALINEFLNSHATPLITRRILREPHLSTQICSSVAVPLG